jgi:hypothetical protein
LAVSVSESPTARFRVVLLREIPVSAPMTVTLHSPFFPSAVAVIVAVPSPTAVTRPEGLTEATDCFEEDQVTSFFVAVEGVTWALSWTVSPIPNSLEEGLTETDSTRTSGSFSEQAKRSGRARRVRIASLFIAI